LYRLDQRVWTAVSRSPLESLWDLQGLSIRELAVRTWRSLREDRVPGHAAELGFYFLFSLFPALFCAGSVIGLAARSGPQFYDHILNCFAFLIPTSAMATVLSTFNQTTAAATSSKAVLSLIAALWSASVGISAIQDTLNDVFKIEDSRSYVVARIYAIGLTIVMTVLISLGLASMFSADLVAKLAYLDMHDQWAAMAAAAAAKVAGWAAATSLLALCFAVLYYWAPDFKKRCWRWLTPGGGAGILGWLLASLGLRLYLHFFNNYSVTYGSLGAVIILLTWFYLSGLMLLTGAEINSVIEAAGAARLLASADVAIESGAEKVSVDQRSAPKPS